ncbi:MAG: 6-pyruvoyl tetrahydrobiopterin synthase [Hyphomonas sp. BRH_c22]|uniref:6-carboxytetrahydropterin synthase n=1 Tax=Hyphomonas sp. BRH_c22 TaxID=1629710 RepID=UPI0005F1C2EF|nr:6-carboxytetrahydropterin synthase [Hyphomonas sp. BRH_c22]KJS38171.1 MAG: 6-pyruvoyl tetrahydrobiopterin synthase [Hyphomonas sp. BRH_c22]
MATELANPQTDRASLTPEGRVFAITKSVNFEAAHYMGGKPEGHPYRNVHGHSFLLEATVSGTVKPGEQWVEDFSRLTASLQATAGKLDHKLLNEIDGLDVPTLERICLWAAADLAPGLPGLSRVAVSRPSLNERCELVL